MPEPKPDAIRTRAAELGKKLGARGVAAALEKEGYGKVGKSAVAEWLRTDRARRAGAATAKTTKGRTTAPATTKKPGTVKTTSEPDEEDDDAQEGGKLPGELAGVDVDGLDFRELEKLDIEVTKFLGEAFREREERRYAVLARLKLDVRTALNKLRPAPKVDPTADPASLEARANVLARLQKMLDNARGAPPATTPAP